MENTGVKMILQQPNEISMDRYIRKADTLIEALPYIQKFRKKTVVIKYGGSFMYDQAIKDSVMDDIALMKLVGLHPIIVHGGGKDISSFLEQLNIQTQFVDGFRVTTDNVIEVAEMVLSGKINKELVQLLQDRDMMAVGISGKDAGMLKVEKKVTDNVDLGYVGEIIHVDTTLVKTLTDSDFIPVIAPIGSDETGQTYNINADHVAFAIAKALKAEKLIYLTDTDGVSVNPKDENGATIRRLSIGKVPELIEKGIISGGMIPKVENSVDAIKAGVKSVHILDGKISHSLLLELFTAAGCGTMISKEIKR